MPTQITTTRQSRRGRQPHDEAGPDAAGLPQQVSRLRDEVFELVNELHRAQAMAPRGELEGAADQMQSIANELGDVEASLTSLRR